MESAVDIHKVVVHDCKNHNNVIVNCAELLKEELVRQNNPFSKYCDSIIESVGMVSSTLGSLLIDSAKSGLKSVNVHSLLSDVIKSFGKVLDSDLEINIQFKAFNYNIIGDKMKLSNAFVNIMINAWEAMDGYCEMPILEISTENVAVGGDVSNSLLAKKFVKISFSDNGKGISAVDQRKLFKFEFSTKVDNNDRGVGLSSVKEAVRECGGFIYLEKSSLGKGTTFAILLPVSNEDIHAG